VLTMMMMSFFAISLGDLPSNASGARYAAALIDLRQCRRPSVERSIIGDQLHIPKCE
jgi:hypothetical protein